MNQDKLKALFLLSGIELYAATPKHNPYPGMMTFRGPIWDCYTEFGAMTVGWRKRVIEIQWDITEGNPSKEVFTEYENTTFSPGLIHAWGYVETLDYLVKLRNYMRSAARARANSDSST